jgi:hypothetical protein
MIPARTSRRRLVYPVELLSAIGIWIRKRYGASCTTTGPMNPAEANVGTSETDSINQVIIYKITFDLNVRGSSTTLNRWRYNNVNQVTDGLMMLSLFLDCFGFKWLSFFV